MSEVTLNGESLTPQDVEDVARSDATVTITDSAWRQVKKSRERVIDVLELGDPVYGINTGFGELVDREISSDDIETLQENLLRSHAAGTGDEIDRSTVRAMMLTRINTLLKGFSGVRTTVIDLLQVMLNRGVTPVVYSKGSLGASGDLAPLAHLALVLIGDGRATVEGELMTGDAALSRINEKPLSLQAKEGLALINGTQLTVSRAALLLRDAERILAAADIAGALTTEATMSTTTSAHPCLHEVRPHSGHSKTARNLRELTAESEIIESHRNCNRVQDAYSIRCMPQVHGAIRDAVHHLREAVETELNSATDNPLVFAADRADTRASGVGETAVVSGGNFHGEPLALPLEYVSDSLTELAAISERRIDRLLNPNIQEPHLPAFLVADNGLQSGYMIAQYTAADLVSRNRNKGDSATDTIPVSGNQEDHVSMSAASAQIAQEIVKNTCHVVATELVCATQALDFIDYEPGTGTAAVREYIRKDVPHLEADRRLTTEIETVATHIRSGSLIDAVESNIELNLD